MLSRVASSLYWMSRYIERAENVARILDVNLQLLLDFRSLDEEGMRDHWMPIVQCTGDQDSFLASRQQATAAAVAEFMVFDRDNPNSILSCPTILLGKWRGFSGGREAMETRQISASEVVKKREKVLKCLD